MKIIDDFLDENDLLKYQEFVKSSGKKQNIIEDEKMTSEFWSKYGSKCGDDVKEIYPYVTITNNSKPVGRHRDAKLREERYKILIYLNDITNGGTKFFVGEDTVRIKNAKNRMVMFDMNIEHESEIFKSQTNKMVIGFRLK